MPQSRHSVSCKSGPLSSEKLILLSRSRRRSLFQRSPFADSGIREFSLKHAKSRATSVRCGEKPGKEKEVGKRAGERGELRESRKTERRNSRRPGKMRIVCTHEGNYPLLFPLPLLVLYLFSPTFREEKERDRERGEKRGGERGRIKFRIFADVSP